MQTMHRGKMRMIDASAAAMSAGIEQSRDLAERA
jgi:hypothetical protein